MLFRTMGAGALFAALTLASGAYAQHPAASAAIGNLHDALHLTAAQEDGWRAYKAAIQPDPSADSRHRSASRMMPSLTTPRRIDLINAEMTADMAFARRQGDAVKAFYASLTPEQQHAFDRQTLQGSGGGSQPGGRAPAPSSQGPSQPPLPQPSTNTLPRPQG